MTLHSEWLDFESCVMPTQPPARDIFLAGMSAALLLVGEAGEDGPLALMERLTELLAESEVFVTGKLRASGQNFKLN